MGPSEARSFERVKQLAAFVVVGSLSAFSLYTGQESDPGKPATAKSSVPSGAVVETLATELACGTGGLEVDAKGFVYCSDFGSKLGAGGIGGRCRIEPNSFSPYQQAKAAARTRSSWSLSRQASYVSLPAVVIFILRLSHGGHSHRAGKR